MSARIDDCVLCGTSRDQVGASCPLRIMGFARCLASQPEVQESEVQRLWGEAERF